MPRQPRLLPPGSIVHIVCRFVDGGFRITCAAERGEYLRRLGIVMARTDWRIIAYGVMSNHIHLVAMAGTLDLEGFMKALNGGFATWMNKRQERRGPLFAGRPTTIICGADAVGYLVSYVSNNPPRAGVVRLARESSWTSHRLYLEPTGAPSWLHIELGLELSGFSSRASGRKSFDEFVNRHREEPRNDALSGRQNPPATTRGPPRIRWPGASRAARFRLGRPRSAHACAGGCSPLAAESQL